MGVRTDVGSSSTVRCDFQEIKSDNFNLENSYFQRAKDETVVS